MSMKIFISNILQQFPPYFSSISKKIFHQEGLSEVLASPQLQQSLSALTQAVHSDQLPVLLASLGLDPSVRTPGMG